MNRLAIAGMLALTTTVVLAQGANSDLNNQPMAADTAPYTTLGPAGAGAYVEPRGQTPRDARRHRRGATGNAVRRRKYGPA